MNVASVNQELVDASVEQIEAMALKAAQAEAGGDTDESAAAEVDVGAVDDAGAASEEAEQGVKEASPGQAAEPAKEDAGGKTSDKELNFAKLRTKAESLEREVQKLADENKRLAERQYVADLPGDHAQKVVEVDAELAAIGAKFNDGNMAWEDYQAQLRDASQRRDGLIKAALKAEISQEMREQAARSAEESTKKSWDQTVESFISAKPDAVDYAADEAKQRDLNTYVKALAADPDNSDKNFEWFLQEAHGLVKSKHRIASATQTQSQEAKPVEPATTATSPIHTLSDLPGGLTPAKSEIEQFDQVSGAAVTNRFMNMTSAQIDAELAKLG